jgi:thioredoxin-dependent peroxiredoxin
MTVTLHKKPVRLAGAFLEVGQKAPDFTLINQDLQEKSLKDFSGKKLLVIVPSLDTPVCLTSGQKFQQKVQETKGLSLIIISADLPFAQKRSCAANGIDKVVTLSMMRDKAFAKDYGVLIEDGPLSGLCARAVILLDENNVVLYRELVPEITEEPDYQKALLAL